MIIYVLKCKGDTYYIGKTSKTAVERFMEHVAGKGSEWTQLHEPIDIVETLPFHDNADEDKYTKKYMQQYGIDFVRGGTYTQCVLPEYQLLALRDEFRTMGDTCYLCGGSGHFAKDCEQRKRVVTTTSQQISSVPVIARRVLLHTVAPTQTRQRRCPQKVMGACYRCGRQGHYSNTCYAKTTVDGEWLSEFSSRPTINRLPTYDSSDESDESDEYYSDSD